MNSTAARCIRTPPSFRGDAIRREQYGRGRRDQPHLRCLRNGAQILRAFDVINEVGADTADTRAFKDISPSADGKLHLKFDPERNPAIVSAIEITRGIPGKLVPIRVVSSEHPYTDKQGQTWAARRLLPGWPVSRTHRAGAECPPIPTYSAASGMATLPM